jgi:hypothetical protein
MSPQTGKRLRMRENLVSTGPAERNNSKFKQIRIAQLSRMGVAVPSFGTGSILSTIRTFVGVVYHNSRMAMRRRHRLWFGRLRSTLCYEGEGKGCGVTRDVWGTRSKDASLRVTCPTRSRGLTRMSVDAGLEWFILSSACKVQVQYRTV